MKKNKILFVLITLLLFSFKFSYRCDAQDSTLYKVKLERYTSWKKTGMIVTISGATLMAVGAGIRIAGAPAESDDAWYAAAYACLGVGFASVIPGSIFWGIGSNKKKEYQIRLNDVRSGFYLTPDKLGLKLTFRF